MGTWRKQSEFTRAVRVIEGFVSTALQHLQPAAVWYAAYCAGLLDLWRVKQANTALMAAGEQATSKPLLVCGSHSKAALCAAPMFAGSAA